MSDRAVVMQSPERPWRLRIGAGNLTIRRHTAPTAPGHLRMLLKEYRLLSFACFGTLIDRDTGIATALRSLAARSGRHPRREDLLAAFRHHEHAVLQARPGDSFREVLADAHSRLARDWAVPCPDDEHLLFARSIMDWPAFPDAAGSLQYLKRYFRLAIVSNGDRDAIRAAGRRLEVGFDLVCSAEDAGAFKPDRRPFDLLLARADRLGVGPRRSLHVATSVPHDLVPAAATGLACAWLDRAASGGAVMADAEPSSDRFDYVFRSLAHLVRLHQEQLRS